VDELLRSKVSEAVWVACASFLRYQRVFTVEGTLNIRVDESLQLMTVTIDETIQLASHLLMQESSLEATPATDAAAADILVDSLVEKDTDTSIVKQNQDVVKQEPKEEVSSHRANSTSTEYNSSLSSVPIPDIDSVLNDDDVFQPMICDVQGDLTQEGSDALSGKRLTNGHSNDAEFSRRSFKNKKLGLRKVFRCSLSQSSAKKRKSNEYDNGTNAIHRNSDTDTEDGNVILPATFDDSNGYVSDDLTKKMKSKMKKDEKDEIYKIREFSIRLKRLKEIALEISSPILSNRGADSYGEEDSSEPHHQGIYSDHLSLTGTLGSPCDEIKPKKVKQDRECPVCFKVFHNPSQLARHLIAEHNVERPWQCEHCSNAYKHSKNLNDHVQTDHTKIRFPCSLCGVEYTRKLMLGYHMNRVHRNLSKKFLCDICGAEYSSKFRLGRHKKSKKCGRHKCPDCSAVFHMYTLLRDHILTLHPETSASLAVPRDSGKFAKFARESFFSSPYKD